MRGVVQRTTVHVSLSFQVGHHPCLTPDQVPTFSGGARNFLLQQASGWWSHRHRNSVLTGCLPPQHQEQLGAGISGPLALLPGNSLSSHCLGDRGRLSAQTHTYLLPLCVQEKKERRAENLRRRLENERKAEIVQVVSVALPGGRAGGRVPDTLAPLPHGPLVVP